MQKNTREGGALSVRLLIWFAANPDEELTTADIAVKWPELCIDSDPTKNKYRSARDAVRSLSRHGFLSAEVRKELGLKGLGQLHVQAGPELLAQLGL